MTVRGLDDEPLASIASYAEAICKALVPWARQLRRISVPAKVARTFGIEFLDPSPHEYAGRGVVPMELHTHRPPHLRPSQRSAQRNSTLATGLSAEVVQVVALGQVVYGSGVVLVD